MDARSFYGFIYLCKKYEYKQLFLVNNDVIELGCLERESHLTDRTKYDGTLFKVRILSTGRNFFLSTAAYHSL